MTGIVGNNSVQEINRSFKSIEKELGRHYKDIKDILYDNNLTLNKLYQIVRLRNVELQMLRRM